MSFFEKCLGCRQKRFHICKRKYQTEKMGKITSNDELCRQCYKNIKNLINKNKNGNY